MKGALTPLKARQLAALRVDCLGLTQGELAALLGVARHTISDWERGVRPLPLAHSLAVRWLTHYICGGLPDA